MIWLTGQGLSMSSKAKDVKDGIVGILKKYIEMDGEYDDEDYNYKYVACNIISEMKGKPITEDTVYEAVNSIMPVGSPREVEPMIMDLVLVLQYWRSAPPAAPPLPQLPQGPYCGTYYYRKNNSIYGSKPCNDFDAVLTYARSKANGNRLLIAKYMMVDFNIRLGPRDKFIKSSDLSCETDIVPENTICVIIWPDDDNDDDCLGYNCSAIMVYPMDN